MNLSKAVKFTRVINALTASTTEVTSTILDMQGFDGVMFLVSLGSTVTSGSVISAIVRNGTANSTSGMVAKGTVTTTASAASANNQNLLIDLYRPLNRYVDLDLTRTTQNAVVDNVTAIQYGAGLKPTVNDTNTFLSTVLVLGS